jgi:hypothetical protein
MFDRSANGMGPLAPWLAGILITLVRPGRAIASLTLNVIPPTGAI